MELGIACTHLEDHGPFRALRTPSIVTVLGRGMWLGARTLVLKQDGGKETSSYGVSTEFCEVICHFQTCQMNEERLA